MPIRNPRLCPVTRALDGIKDISFNRLTAHDVVRHRLVGEIVAAYEDFDTRRQSMRSTEQGAR